MNQTATTHSKPTLLPAIILSLQLALFLAIFFNIPIARQVIGFLYLTLAPGSIILRLLRLEKINRIEKVLFTVGLSIAFLMATGLLINELGHTVGISKPLTLPLMLLVVSIFAVPLCIWDWIRYVNKSTSDENNSSVWNNKVYLFGFMLSSLPLLSIIGTSLVNIPPHTNNSVLLLMIILVSLLVILAAFSTKLIPPSLYPIALFTIALTLLFHVSLVTNYIHGGDIFGEYASLKLTQQNSYWDPTVSYGYYYSMLSVTILPTIYSTILDLEGTWILKIVYPLIFSFVPLGLYQLCRIQFKKEIAFFSVFFFMANTVFFGELLQLARQMIAELFFVLLFLTIFHRTMNSYQKWFCFAFLGFGLVVSHYSIAYLFLSIIFVIWFFSFLRKRKSTLSLSTVALFATMAFTWYIYTSSSTPFNVMTGMINHVLRSFVSEFFNPQSRGTQVLQGVGVGGVQTFWHLIGRSLFYVAEFFILVGVLASLVKQRTAFFDKGYNIAVFMSIAILLAGIAVPNFAEAFNMSRFYHVSLFFIAPFFILGGTTILNLLSRKRIRVEISTIIIILIVLIPFFLFQTAFVYEIARDESSSLPLSRYRFDRVKLYGLMGVIEEAEVSGAAWLCQYEDSNRYVYADISSGAVFAYTNILNGVWLSLGVSVPSGSYVYLRQYNIYDGVVFSGYGATGAFNVTQIVPSLDTMNTIYSSGSYEILKVP